MPLRIVTLSAGVGVAVVLALFTWPQLLGVQRAPLFAHAVSLRGLFIIGLLGVAAVFVALTVRAAGARALTASIAALLVGAAAVNSAALIGSGTTETFVSHPADASVTVLTWNTLGDEVSAQVIADLVIQHDADVVALPETTQDLASAVADELASAGRSMAVFTVSSDETSAAASTSLLIAASLGDYAVDEAAPTTAVLPSLVATPVSGRGPTIVAVHTLAPLPPMMVGWEADLRWVADTCRGPNTIVAGDFNATVDHFAGLETTPLGTLGGCRDAGATVGGAALGTWPTSLPAILGSPIDHVLATRDWQVTGFDVVTTLDGQGSDHRPLIVQLDR